MPASKNPVVQIYTPDYWEDACKHLSKKDRVMKRLIPKFGDACLESRGDAFTTLARSIVGQQISVKAAQTVWDKFAVLPRKLTPANVLKLKVDDMRAAGLSARKVEYLVDLAIHFDSGAVHVDAWKDMADELIIDELVAIRGIGRWTAEMFLMFRLHRPDVFPIDDLGIVNAIVRAYRLRKRPAPVRLHKIAEPWRPYRSVACWYLWASLETVTPGKKKR